MKDLIAADYDNTFSTHPELYHRVKLIITGRSWQEAQELLREYEGPKLPIFFNPVGTTENDLMKIVHHKADIINKAGVKIFYEDQPKDIAYLQVLCPSCTVIQVKDGEYAAEL